MPEAVAETFTKAERIVSRRLMETLFTKGNSKMLSVFPLRMVYMVMSDEEMATYTATGPSVRAQVLVSVSKRHFKHAVKRNRVKRQIREAYRKNKHLLLDMLEPLGKNVALAFMWQADELTDSNRVDAAVKKLLSRSAENISRT